MNTIFFLRSKGLVAGTMHIQQINQGARGARGREEFRRYELGALFIESPC